MHRYMYHYVSEEGVIYLCITDDVSCLVHTWMCVYVCVTSLFLCFRFLKGQRLFSFWKMSGTGELRSAENQ